LTGTGSALWPGVLLLDERSQVVSIMEPGRWWLEELGFIGDPARDPLPFAVLALTVQTHLELVFAGVGVRSRHELVGLVHGSSGP
jgi:hypothetical protein